MRQGLYKKLLRRVILALFLATIPISASMANVYSLDNNEGWVAFEKAPTGAMGLKAMDLSRKKISRRRVRADKTKISKGRFTSELRLKLDFPGAFLTRPDDNGLLAGRYDLLSLLPGEKVQTFTVNGSLQPDKLGEPNLAYVCLKVRLPYPVEDLDISVIANYTQLDGSYDIAPVQEQLPESFRAGIDKDYRKFRMKKKIYKANEFFSPPLEYELVTFHGVRFAEISFSPLRYNPVRKILKVCPSAELIIRYNVGTENDIPSSVSTTLVDQIVESFCFDGSSSYGSSTTQMPVVTESKGKFVIVSHSSLINTHTYDDYISYRKNQGYVHLETIDTANTLFDEPSEIRHRLLELYQNPGFDYLLLVGDETLVPVSHEDENGYHDKMYSRLDGDDTMPDVFMGRFLTGNETGFRNILDHQIGQENNEVAMNEVMMTWGIEHFGGDPDIADRFCSSHYSTLIMDNPDGGLGYNVHRYYKTKSANIPRRYGGSYSFCNIPLSEFEPWTLIPNPFYIDSSECTNAIIDRWNKGVAVIGHRDHGSTKGPGSPYIPYTIFSEQITSDFFPLFTSTNCSTGNFRGYHDINFAYQSQVNTSGTCATFAATRTTYSGDNDYYHLALYDVMFPDGAQWPIRNVGEIFLAGLLGGRSHSRTYFHIFGDPMTTLRLSLPTRIKLNIVSPQQGSYIRDVVNVTGTASGDEFKSYELYYWNEDDPENKTLINTSSFPVAGGVLGVWDTTILYPDGGYVLGLKVTNNKDNHFWFNTGVMIDNHNEPPVFEQISNKIVAFKDKNFKVTTMVTDPDDPQTPAGTLTISAEGLPEGASFDSITRTFSWTPQESDLYKTYHMTFKASDSEYTISKKLDIYVLELFQITNDLVAQGDPVIYKNNIIWRDRRNGYWAIYLYDLGDDGIYGTADDRGEFQITTDPSYQTSGQSENRPAIYGNNIVWRDNRRNENRDIYLYDLGDDGIYGTADDRGEFQVASGSSVQDEPAIYENKIVWRDSRNGWNIYLYDLGDDGIYGTADDRGEFQITNDPSYQGRPDIYKNKIVWYDRRNENFDIYLYDLGDDGIYGTADDRGEFQITSDPSEQRDPAVSENKVVWFDIRNGNSDIYLYDLGDDGIYGTADDRGEFQITSDPSGQFTPVIYENKIVWYDDRNGNNYDIYFYDLGDDGIYGTADDRGEFQLTSDSSREHAQDIYKNNIVWSGRNSDIYMVTLSEPPSPPPLPPTVSLVVTPTTVEVGEPFTITVSGESPVGLASVWWFVEDKNNPSSRDIPGTVDGVSRNLAPAQNFGAGGGMTSYTCTRTVTINTAGEYLFKANARDVLYPVPGEPHQASEGAGMAVVLVNVKEVNRPPVVEPKVKLKVAKGSNFVYQIKATDPDGDPLTYSIGYSKPFESTFDETTGTFTWNNVECSWPINLYVDDKRGHGLVGQELMIEVEEDRIGRVIPNNNPYLPTAYALDSENNDHFTIGLVGDNLPVYLGQRVKVSGELDVAWKASGPALVGMLYYNVTNITDLNQPPIFEPQIIIAHLDEGIPFKLNFEATDPDKGDTVMFEVKNAPDWLKIQTTPGNPAQITLSGTPVFQGKVTTPIHITACDYVLCVQRELELEINQAPIIDPIPDQVVNEGETLDFTVTAQNPGGLGQTRWTIEPQLPAWLSVVEKVEENVGSYIRLQGKPGYDDSGEYIFTFIASEQTYNTILEDSKSVKLTVNDVPRAPVFGSDLVDKQIDEARLLRFVVRASDPDGNHMVSLQAEGLPEGAEFKSMMRIAVYPNPSIAAAFSWEPGYNQAGQYQVNFIAKNEQGLSSSKTITITVNDVNRPPVIDKVPDQVMNEAEELRLAIKASDPDQEPVHFLLGPNMPRFAEKSGYEDHAEIIFKPGYDDAGVYENITVSVEDQAGLTASTSFTLTVKDVNRAPVFGSGLEDKQIDEGKLLKFVVSAADPGGGHMIDLRAEGLPEGAELKSMMRIAVYPNPSIAAAFSWEPGYNQAGQYQVNFIAKNEQGLSTSETITITVNDVAQNSAPALESIGNKSVNEAQLLRFEVSATDPDGDPVSYDVDKLPEGAHIYYTGIRKATMVFEWTPTYEQAGTYRVNFTASDGELTDSREIIIQVSNVVAEPPTVSLRANPTAVTADEPFTTTVKEAEPVEKKINFVAKRKKSRRWYFFMRK